MRAFVKDHWEIKSAQYILAHVSENLVNLLIIHTRLELVRINMFDKRSNIFQCNSVRQSNLNIWKYIFYYSMLNFVLQLIIFVLNKSHNRQTKKLIPMEYFVSSGKLIFTRNETRAGGKVGGREKRRKEWKEVVDGLSNSHSRYRRYVLAHGIKSAYCSSFRGKKSDETARTLPA